VAAGPQQLIRLINRHHGYVPVVWAALRCRNLAFSPGGYRSRFGTTGIDHHDSTGQTV
jgi:hypothetical protein